MAKNKKTYKPWTTKEINNLIDMRKNGSSVKVIADILGRTVSSVNNRIALVEAPKANKEARRIAVLETMKAEPKKGFFKRLFGL